MRKDKFVLAANVDKNGNEFNFHWITFKQMMKELKEK